MENQTYFTERTKTLLEDPSTGYIEGTSNGIHSQQEGLTEKEIQKRIETSKRPLRDFGSALGWGTIE